MTKSGFKYLSVCSGIEAASQALQSLGWRAAAFSEIDDRPREVLAHHYPDVPLHGDFRTIGANDYGPIDLLVGGTPCQSFSISGLRKGMDDPRGNLSLHYLRLADRKRPRWVVWENVAGVLSSKRGRDFGSFLGGLVECGYGFAYRVLDAQYVRTRHFGRAVPQRRRRVFVIGHFGDWRPAAAVLFDAEGLRRNSPPRRRSGQGFAGEIVPSLTASGRGVERSGETRGQDPVIAEVVGALSDGAHNGGGLNGQDAYTGRILPVRKTLDEGQTPIAFNSRQDPDAPGDYAGPLDTQTPQAQAIATPWAVRRLTPLECERLQGFPDNFTLIPTPRVRTVKPDMAAYLKRHGADVWTDERGRQRTNAMADGPRYKMLGNSMAVNVMEWIGQRIQQVEDVLGELP